MGNVKKIYFLKESYLRWRVNRGRVGKAPYRFSPLEQTNCVVPLRVFIYIYYYAVRTAAKGKLFLLRQILTLSSRPSIQRVPNSMSDGVGGAFALLPNRRFFLKKEEIIYKDNNNTVQQN